MQKREWWWDVLGFCVPMYFTYGCVKWRCIYYRRWVTLKIRLKSHILSPSSHDFYKAAQLTADECRCEYILGLIMNRYCESGIIYNIHLSVSPLIRLIYAPPQMPGANNNILISPILIHHSPRPYQQKEERSRNHICKYAARYTSSHKIPHLLFPCQRACYDMLR